MYLCSTQHTAHSTYVAKCTQHISHIANSTAHCSAHNESGQVSDFHLQGSALSTAPGLNNVSSLFLFVCSFMFVCVCVYVCLCLCLSLCSSACLWFF